MYSELQFCSVQFSSAHVLSTDLNSADNKAVVDNRRRPRSDDAPCCWWVSSSLYRGIKPVLPYPHSITLSIRLYRVARS